MVSFFGLKLGGDRKKKGEKTAEVKKEFKPIDRNALGEGQYFGTTLNKSALLDPANIPRPDTSASNRSLRRPKLPYAWAGASNSMVDLSAGPGATFHATQPTVGGSSLRHLGGSEANMYMRWNNSSSTSLVPPNRAAFGSSSTPSGPDGRPGTAGSSRTKAWVNPLDVHFCRDNSIPSRPTTATGDKPPPPIGSNAGSNTGSNVTSSAPQIPKSPLGQFEFNLPPFDMGGKLEAEPREEQRQESKPAPLQQVMSRSPPSPKSYPSPPHSVEDLEPPMLRLDTGLRPPSRQRDGSASQDPRNPSRFGQQGAPASLPSPAASVPRSSEEKEKLWTGPVIQNVRAKRDTLTVTAPRRQSFTMDVDQPAKQVVEARPEPVRRPGTAGNGSPPPRSTRRPRPPPLEQLNVSAQSPQQRQSPPEEYHNHGQWRSRGPSPPEEHQNQNQWRSRGASPLEQQNLAARPPQQRQSPPEEPHNHNQWRSRGPSPFEERENRFQGPGSHQLRDSSPYRRGPARPMDGHDGEMRPQEYSRPAPRVAPTGYSNGREREPQWPDRGQSHGPPRPRGPPARHPDDFPPPNRGIQAQSTAPRPPPQGQYRAAARTPREDETDHQQAQPRQEAPENTYLGPSPMPAAEPAYDLPPNPPRQAPEPQPTVADPYHPSKGPQDFNTRPGFGQSSKRRPPPPLRLRRDVDSPSTENPSSRVADNQPSNPITSAKFVTPRQAPSPPSTAAFSSHQPSSPPPHQLQPPPPLLESAQILDSMLKPASPTKPNPSFIRTPDISSNPNWPLVDSGPPSAAFTLQSPDGGASSLGGSKPNSPAGMPLASPAFGTTFNLGGNSPAGPSHWTPQRPTHDRRLEAPTTTSVRPDHGLRAPTGIADEFRVKFI